MDISTVFTYFNEVSQVILNWATSPAFYIECALVICATFTAFTISAFIKKKAPSLRTPPEDGALLRLRANAHKSKGLLFPLLNVLALHVAVLLSGELVNQNWLSLIAESLAVIFVIYTFVSLFVNDYVIRTLIKWIIIPLAILEIFGLLHSLTTYLDTLDIEIGNIRISAYGFFRVMIFGFFLFWLGRISNNTGQRIIRSQTNLAIGTREVFAKLFEVFLFILIFVLLLQVMGINLTALAVFGGALGVGLGFGLQSIASNFISGIIILLDRSITLGDYVETEDGLTGTVREINLRSTVLETFDGRDIVVPNEKFITGNVTNWTHKDTKQRYPLNFQVAYKTDLDLLFPLVRDICCQHPKVLHGPDYPQEIQPDAEIQSFDDSGITILVEFWMESIDDGTNHVGADLLYGIWKALRENEIEIPYPQREVRILKD